jgi:glycosyltransferase involved in cell wall biosynthesis
VPEPILQVISDTNGRGAQIFAVDLAASLGQRGRSVTTVALTAGDYGGLGVPVLGRRPRGPGTLLALRRQAASAGVVVAHGSTTLSAAAVSMTGSGVPFVYRMIGDPAWWAGHGWRRRSVGAFLRRAARVVVLDQSSAAVVMEQHRVSPESIAVVPNGVPAERFPLATAATRAAARLRLALDPDAAVVACIGALGREKNVAGAIEAVGLLPEAILLVAGAGPEHERLCTLAARRAPGRVRFLGTAHPPAEVLAAADTLVLPSWTEGMPAVLIEAGLTGIAAVASDVGAVREVIVDGETGFVVPAGDEHGLATALRDAVRDRTRLGAAARRRCLSHFTMDAITDAWSAVIDQAIGTGRGS